MKDRDNQFWEPIRDTLQHAPEHTMPEADWLAIADRLPAPPQQRFRLVWLLFILTGLAALLWLGKQAIASESSPTKPVATAQPLSTQSPAQSPTPLATPALPTTSPPATPAVPTKKQMSTPIAFIPRQAATTAQPYSAPSYRQHYAAVAPIATLLFEVDPGSIRPVLSAHHETLPPTQPAIVAPRYTVGPYATFSPAAGSATGFSRRTGYGVQLTARLFGSFSGRVQVGRQRWYYQSASGQAATDPLFQPTYPAYGLELVDLRVQATEHLVGLDIQYRPGTHRWPVRPYGSIGMQFSQQQHYRQSNHYRASAYEPAIITETEQTKSTRLTGQELRLGTGLDIRLAPRWQIQIEYNYAFLTGQALPKDRYPHRLRLGITYGFDHFF